MLRLSHALTLATLVALPARSAAQSVLVVDAAGGPGSTHVTIQAALDAALAGDLVLVRSGAYDGFALFGKAVNVAADVDAVVSLSGQSVVGGIPTGSRVTLSGLGLPEDPSVPSSLSLLDNPGSLRLDDCAFRGHSGAFGPPRPALTALFCNDVAVSGCHFDVVEQGFGGTSGQPAARLQGTTAHLADSSFAGGDGADASFGFVPGEAGGAGLEIAHGFVVLSGGTLTGGDGGRGSEGEVVVPCGDGGPGGPGLLLDGGTPLVLRRDVAVSGGAGGPGGPGVGLGDCDPGPDGPATSVVSGQLLALAGTARSLAAPGVVREGDTLHVELQGAPGEVAFWLLSADSTFVNGFGGGALLVGGAPLVLALGTTDATGALQLTTSLSPLPPAVVAIGVQHQAFLGGSGFVGTGSRISWLLDATVP